MSVLLPLGAKVTFAREHILERIEQSEQAGFARYDWPTRTTILNADGVARRRVKRWVRPVDMEHRILHAGSTGQVTGFIAGAVTVAAGFTHCGSYDDPPVFIPVGYERVYRVAWNMNRLPALLRIADVTPEASNGGA